MDMWAPYAKLVREHAVNAQILFDRFHIVKHLNEAMDAGRRNLWCQLTSKERVTFKRTRWLLLKNPWNQVKLEKHLSRGLYFLNAFTYSRALDDTVPICCNQPWPDNSYDLKAQKGLADYQQKFRWVTSFDYELPFGKNRLFMNQNRALDPVFGGWHASGILTATSGFQFTPQMEEDSPNAGAQGFTNPDRIKNGNLPSSQQSIYQWFDVGAFADAAPYTFGNSGYNVLIGPGLFNLDLGIRMIFSVSERQKVEFRAEFV